MSLATISIINARNETEAVAWDAIRTDVEPISAIVGLRSVLAIVITQDCDTIRAPDISLCEIKPLSSVIKQTQPNTPQKWVKFLTFHAVQNLKWFYLPPDAGIGFNERMAVDFLSTLRVAREDLEASKHLRRGRLNNIADEHFRERLAEFFRRYPYNEWYPFKKEEFEAYRDDRAGEAALISPYDYQV